MGIKKNLKNFFFLNYERELVKGEQCGLWAFWPLGFF